MKKKYQARVLKEKKAIANAHKNPQTNFSTVGGNRKTGWAFYYPIISCARWKTQECGEYCYLHSGQMCLDNFIKKTAQVYNFVENTPLEEAATKISYDIPYGIVSFRWLGGGELTPKLVKVINRVVKKRPDIKHYIYTKAIDLALRLDQSITINFSIDRSSKKQVIEKLLTDPRCKSWLVSYVQIDANEEIPENLQDLVCVIHPLNKRKSVIDAVAEKSKICGFALDKKMTCNACKRCIIPKAIVV